MLSDKLIQIIDERIEKKMSQKHYVVKYLGIVKEIHEKTVLVAIAGYDTKFALPNKSHEVLQVNDGVWIECVGDNLTSGFISEKLGQ